MSTTCVWSLRGNHWIKEVFVCTDEAEETIRDLLDLEPNVLFRVSDKAPGPVHPAFD